MSDPPPPPPAPPPAAGRARWMNGLIAVLLCVGVGGALAGARPVIERALEPPPPADEPPPPPRHEAPPAPPRSTTYAFDDHPRFAPDDDEPHLTELERRYPDGMWPGQHQSSPRGTAGPTTNARPGHAQTALTLRERAEPAAPVTGQVAAGTALTVLGEAGTWALVVLRDPQGAALFGWTPRTGVTVP